MICSESTNNQPWKLHVSTEDLDGIADYPVEVAVRLLAAIRQDIQRLIPEEAVEAAEENDVLTHVLEPEFRK
eukprot:scaffold680324_cov94-Prasinocladus_malaysianus.AAC.1